MLKRLDFLIPDAWEEPLIGLADSFGVQFFSSPEITSASGSEENVAFTGRTTFSLIVSLQEQPVEHIQRRFCSFLTEQKVPFQQTETDFADNEDWMEPFRAAFTPIIVDSHVIVRPPWTEPLPEETSGKTVIFIDPGMAFGTGTHETTRLCLQLLTELSLSSTDDALYLDIGAGSGILAFYLVKKGAKHVTAVELDGPAVENLKKNALLNDINTCLTVLCGDLRDFSPTQAATGICANLTSPVLLDNFHRFFRWLSPGGWAIFSGVNSTNIPDVRQGLASLPWTCQKEIQEGEWHALLVRKP